MKGLSFHSKSPWILASLHSIVRSHEVIGMDQHVYITHAKLPMALSLNEGFVTGEVLASTPKKEWLSLHVQETTATFLSATLLSRQSEQIPSTIPPSTSRETRSSSTLSINTNDNALVDKKDVDHGKKKSDNFATEKLKIGDKLEDPVTISSKSVKQAPQVVKDVKKAEKVYIDNSDLDSNTNKSIDIHLNIRLPRGISVQEKFEPTSTLKMVKNYIDEKQESSIGHYDLAIPYPHNVFIDQDLTKTLTKLSLLDRKALIIVPHLKSTSHYKPQSVIPNHYTSVSTVATSAPDGEGYFSLRRKVLSYVNPLPYLRGNNSV
ncbi:plant UBX domain-containing protein 11 [Lactuca sativa]|uniref:plant UBX domain-containing protein 11 n=1 Tax=Lactuca sativa TaxID=4236 RepID=UPI0022B0538C|nr:plant UBX domain-containing protein 11 [Lactuca sativa]